MTTNIITKVLTPANCGETGMHDTYITIPVKYDPESIFGNQPIDLTFIDKKTGAIINLRYRLEINKEHRLSKLGPYLKSKNAKPGDTLTIEWIDQPEVSSGNLALYIDIN